MYKAGGRWVGSNKVGELKKKIKGSQDISRSVLMGFSTPLLI